MNAQERFLMTRMAANALYNERIQTRVVQAIGRCTRSLEDYSAVVVSGEELPDYLADLRRRGSTPLTRTVLKEPKTSDLAEQLYDAFVGYETAQYSRTDPLALHQVSGTIDEQHARA